MKNLIGQKEASTRVEGVKIIEKPESEVLSKVPAVTLGFWIIKIAATTLGETGGDTVSMTMNLGYLTGTAIFLTALGALVACQIMVRRFHPPLSLATIVASTTAGTTMADFADRSLGIGYAGGSSILLFAVLAMLGLCTGRSGRSRWTRSAVRESNSSIGRRSRFHKRSGRRSEIGSPMMPVSAMSRDRSSSAWRWSLSLQPITGRLFLVSCCSGQPSFSQDRLARRWVICWTSLWITGDLRSVVLLPRRSSQP